MNTKSINTEASIEFAIDNALERINILSDKDRMSVLNEYREWLSYPRNGLDVLIINFVDE